jgi:hypothetical protein
MRIVFGGIPQFHTIGHNQNAKVFAFQQARCKQFYAQNSRFWNAMRHSGFKGPANKIGHIAHHTDSLAHNTMMNAALSAKKRQTLTYPFVIPLLNEIQGAIGFFTNFEGSGETTGT